MSRLLSGALIIVGLWMLGRSAIAPRVPVAGRRAAMATIRQVPLGELRGAMRWTTFQHPQIQWSRLGPMPEAPAIRIVDIREAQYALLNAPLLMRGRVGTAETRPSAHRGNVP